MTEHKSLFSFRRRGLRVGRLEVLFDLHPMGGVRYRWWRKVPPGYRGGWRDGETHGTNDVGAALGGVDALLSGGTLAKTAIPYWQGFRDALASRAE